MPLGPMQLYILGPAFGLPSIDAECNAAVALLQLRVRDGYEIVPTHHDASHLPLLIDGGSRLSGFNNIARYLCDKRISDERTRLSSSAHSDAIAITSFLETHAHTLLDISLYVSFENYRHATRPAFTKILPWHTNYILPPQRRAAARKNTEHLGIASIDIDDVHEDLSDRPAGMDNSGVGKEQQAFGEATQKRASLLLPRKDTLMSMLKRPEHAAVFKLNALAENFFEPLQELLGDSEYLLGEDMPNAVDCLLFGHLSLMLYPKLPHDWLAATMRRKYGRLVSYAERMHRDLRFATDVDAVLRLNQPGSVQELEAKKNVQELSLPWRPAVRSKFSERVRDIRLAVLEHIPVLGSASSRLHLWYAPGGPLWQELLPPILYSTTAALGALGYLAFHLGWVAWPHGEAIHIFGRKRFSDFGFLENALSGVSLLGPQVGSRGSVGP